MSLDIAVFVDVAPVYVPVVVAVSLSRFVVSFSLLRWLSLLWLLLLLAFVPVVAALLLMLALLFFVCFLCFFLVSCAPPHDVTSCEVAKQWSSMATNGRGNAGCMCCPVEQWKFRDNSARWYVHTQIRRGIVL